MSVAEIVSVGSVTASAPHEPNISTEHPFNIVVYIDAGDCTSWSGSIVDLVAPQIEGCGRVDLHSIAVSALGTAASQEIYVGVSDIGSSAPIKALAAKSNGLMYKTTSYNFGSNVQKVIIPEDTISKQIRPPSSFLPMLKLSFSKSKDLFLQLEIRLIVHGLRQHYVSLK